MKVSSDLASHTHDLQCQTHDGEKSITIDAAQQETLSFLLFTLLPLSKQAPTLLCNSKADNSTIFRLHLEILHVFYMEIVANLASNCYPF